MNTTKVQLSAAELQLVTNADWILTKNRIIEKVYALFGQVASDGYTAWMRNAGNLPPGILDRLPKISRGEQYQGLPYVMLDFPRFFQKGEIFAFRTLFWWGHFFSVTLHLKGSLKKEFEKRILQLSSLLAKENYHLCIAEDEWQHHFGTDNYVPVVALPRHDFERVVLGNEFLKLSRMWPLTDWDNAKDFLLNATMQWANWTGGQFPSR